MNSFEFIEHIIGSKELFFGYILIGFTLLISISAAIHALIYKRDPRSALLWITLIFFSPIIGACFYYFFGINRIEKKIHKLKLNKINPKHQLKKTFSSLSNLSEIKPLMGGDESFLEMILAINQAKKSISFASYIFDVDIIGLEFVKALKNASNRGVQVRVLLDDVGIAFSKGNIIRNLKNEGISTAAFLPINLMKTRFANLRNHRKTLIIDGEIAFTGGLNISNRYSKKINNNNAIDDIHFKINGEIIPYLQTIFIDDWYFTTKEKLKGKVWLSNTKTREKNNLVARVVPSGPAIDSERIRWVFLGALQSAKKSIKILTPYFLPDKGIVSALCTASLRGINVDIILPGQSDQKLIKWAAQGSLWDLLKMNCKIWYSPAPFDHSKLFIIDDDYVSIGSANWDVRSLRLNFELNLEIYSKEFAKEMTHVFDSKKAKAKIYSLLNFESRPFLIKIRDGFARLFSSYL